MNTKLPRAPAQSRLIPAAAAALLTLALALFTVAIARAADAAAPQASPPPATPAAAPAATAAGAPLTAEDLNTWLEGYLPYALRVDDIAGAVVVVVKDGAVVTERGYGFADVAKRTPVDPKRTLFRPGSVSKLFTWTAVMQQVEQGKIDLDGDINQYLDFKIRRARTASPSPCATSCSTRPASRSRPRASSRRATTCRATRRC